MKRLFLGIMVPKDTQTLLSKGLQPIKMLHPQWRWVSPENYHITLSFLGEIDEKSIENLFLLIENVTRQTEPFNLILSSMTYAPPKKTPRMVWATAYDTGQFGSLVRSIESAISEHINLPDYRKSQDPLSHITLARFEATDEIKPAFPSLKITVPVTRITLFESILSIPQPQYQQIAEFELG